jgi:hypothetical protein
MIRKLLKQERAIIGTNDLQVILKTLSKSDVPVIINKIKERLCGLHLKIENDAFYKCDPPPIGVIPPNLKTFGEIINLRQQQRSPYLAKISVRDNFIALHVDHCIGDGSHLFLLISILGQNVPGFKELTFTQVHPYSKKNFKRLRFTIFRLMYVKI